MKQKCDCYKSFHQVCDLCQGCDHLNVSIEVNKTDYKKEILTQEEVDKRYGKKMIVIDPEKFKDLKYDITIKDPGLRIIDESSDFDWDNYFNNK